MTTIDQLYESYKLYLRDNSNIHYNALLTIEKNKPESARAEAVVFSLLKSNRADVEIYEDPNIGGADFICEYLSNKFLVEVTCIESNTTTKKSGIPNKIPEKIEAFGFHSITSLVRSKASSKAHQMANEPHPRVLAITSEHIGSGILFGKSAIQMFLTSDTKIRVNINENSYEHQDITDLKDSVFFRFKSNGSIEACRKSISAILLVEINKDSCNAYGVLHPEPSKKFHYQLLPYIPFLRINPWPIEDNRIYTEWIIDDPISFKNYYHKI